MRYELRTPGVNSDASTSILIDAASEADALHQARQFGLDVLAVRCIATPKVPAGIQGGQFSLLQFSQEFLALLQAGMNMYEAVTTLAAKEQRSGARRLLQHLLFKLESGASLSEALETEPNIFPDIYVATIRAAERSGDVPVALTRFIEYQAQLEINGPKVVVGWKERL